MPGDRRVEGATLAEGGEEGVEKGGEKGGDEGGTGGAVERERYWGGRRGGRSEREEAGGSILEIERQG